MKQSMLTTFLLISLVSWSALAHAQSLGSTSTPQPVSSGASDITSAARSSWEGWLNHGTGEVKTGSHVPGRRPDLGAATAPLTPSIGLGSELLESEADRSPSRLESKRELDPAGTAIDKNWP